MENAKQAEAQLLVEHEGEELKLSNGLTARIRPFNVEELFSDQLISDLTDVGEALWGQLKVIFTARKIDAASLGKMDILAAFKSAKEPMKRCLKRCIDLELSRVPAPDLPRVLEVFIRQNFSIAQLKSWADLLKSLAAATGTSSSTTSATSASASSATGTSAGASTPARSSNTGSGARSAAKR